MTFGDNLRKIVKILKGNIGVMTLTSGLWNLAGQMVWPFQSLYYLSLGANYFDLGILSANLSFFKILSLMIGGYLTDRFGRKNLVVFLSFAMSSISLLYAFAPSWQWLLVIGALDGILSGLREPAFSALLADSTSPSTRALGYAIWNFGPITFGLLSPFIAGQLVDEWGVGHAIRLLFKVLFGVSFFACILRFILLKETLEKDEHILFSLKDIVSQIFGFLFSASKSLIPLYVVSGLVAFLFGCTDPFWVTYATKDVLALSASEWGLVTISQTLINLMVNPFLAVASDKYGRRKFLLLSALPSLLSLILFTVFHNFLLILVILSIYSLFIRLNSVVFSALFADVVRKEVRGRALALLAILNQLFLMSGSIVGGYLYQSIYKSAPFYLASGVLFITFIVTFFFIREPSIRDE